MLPNAGPTALRITAFEVAALLRADRNAAVRTGRAVATRVDLAGREVRSGASTGSVRLPGPFALRLAGPRAGGFAFLPNGTSSGGALILAGSGTALAVRVDDLTAAVDIRRVSGRGDDGG